MAVVTEVLEKVVGINGRTLTVPFVAFASSSLPNLSDKTIHQNHEVIQRENEIFFLISILVFCHIHIQNVVLKTKHFLF